MWIVLASYLGANLPLLVFGDKADAVQESPTE